MTLNLRRSSLCTCVPLLSLLLVGCGGGGTGSAGEQTLQFGSLTTRVVGTAQPPVTAGGSGAVVTGLAGATISSLTFRDASPTLAESRIVFTSGRDGNQEIYVMNGDGGNETRLTYTAASESDPSLSRDGTRIAFTSLRDGHGEVYVMNVDGSAQTRLTNNSLGNFEPAWSPDGSKIAFRSNRDGVSSIYVMNADGTGQTRLTTDAAGDFSPAWSPIGTKIAFYSNRDGNAEIYLMNPDGTSQSRVAINTASDLFPAWSPDGLRIAFASDRDGNVEIYVINATGGTATRLTNNAAVDSYPSWSPDGTKIAFSTTRDGGAEEIYSMNVDGTSPVRLTSSSNVDYGPSWSTAGSLAFIGAGGRMGSAAAGFLFSEKGDNLVSLLAFDATTRASARLTNLTGNNPGNSNYVFSLTTADSLTLLSYTNNLYVSPTVVVSGAGTATGAIVSYNTTTGYVTTVLPYSANRSGSPEATMEGGQRVFRGPFLGAWDTKGVNRAPHGAMEVGLDAKTGEIVRVR